MAKSSLPQLDSVTSGEVLFTNQSVAFDQGDAVELKETEIGPVPVHWLVAELGTVIQQTQYGISKRGDRSGQYPILRMNNVSDGSLSTDDLQYVDLSLGEFQKFRLKWGDVLFNRTNSFELVGKTAVYDLEGDHVFASYLIRIVTAGSLSPQFLNYYMNMDSAQSRLKRLATRGVSQSNINATKLKGFAIPLPPLSEQQSIANVLHTVQQAKEATEKVIAATRQLKQSLMRHLFTYGPVHFDQSDKVELKETGLGPVPKAWNVIALERVVSQKIVDGVHKTPTYVERGIPFITAKDIVRNRVSWSTCRYIPEAEHKQLTRRVKPQWGDVLLTKVGTVGNVAFVDFETEFSIFVQLALIRPNPEIMIPAFLYWALQTIPAQFEVHSKSSQSTMKFIGTQKIAKVRVHVPPISDQRSIISKLSAVESKLAAEESRFTALSGLFTCLLHHLMTAKTRVSGIMEDGLNETAVR
jgi:type I restriction enzyme, S subunit